LSTILRTRPVLKGSSGLAPPLDRFISTELLEGPREPRWRARHLAGSALAGTACYGVGGAILALSDRPQLAVVAAVAATLILSLLFLLRRGASLDFLANAFVAVSFPCLAGITIATGGGAVTFLFGAAIIPLIAVLLAGRKAGGVWTALTCAYVVGAALLTQSGFEPPLQPQTLRIGLAQFSGAVILVLCTFSITSAYNSARRCAEIEREEARTRARQLEERLATAEKRHLASELERLGDMAGGVAHDFNNTLTVVLGTAELIRTSSIQREVRELSGEIQEASERAAGLTRQLLAYTGKSHVRMEPLDLFELAAKVAAAFVGAPIDILLPRVSSCVMGDRQLLEEAIAGLIVNATEALEGGPGRVALVGGEAHLRRAELSELVRGESCSEGTYAFLEVSDDGCGIASSDLKKVFDPFYSTKFAGRGLGMSALLGITRMHSGALRIDSRLSSGTTVGLFLPIARRGEAGIVEADSADSPRANARN